MATTVPQTKSRTKPSKSESKKAHLALVLEAANEVVRILKHQHISCAVFGSLACKLYGSSRCPKDVDLLIFQDPSKTDEWTAEGLKTLILDNNPRHFYLKLPRDPLAEYRILWYRQSYGGPECKVDILIPGIMHLPQISPVSLVLVDDIPLVPFSLLLLHKLQGWDDHRLAEEAHKKHKQHQDAADLKRMLAMQDLLQHLVKTKPWDDKELFSDEFQELTRDRVQQYCRVFPDRTELWKSLGFEVE